MAEEKTSLLDTLYNEENGKSSLLYRIVLSGEVLVGGDVGAHYQKFFKNFQQDNELITGIYILHPQAWFQTPSNPSGSM
jgi:hypothetical protein